jgi:hypothetical protein
MNQNLSDENFTNYVEEYTGSPLIHKEDIKKIIAIARQNGTQKILDELVFTAKYICGMMRVLKNAQNIPEVQSIEQIKIDLNENIKKGIEKLKEILSASDDTQKKYFENNYFALTAQNFNNLSQLFSDLEAVKKYLNYQKRLPE